MHAREDSYAAKEIPFEEEEIALSSSLRLLVISPLTNKAVYPLFSPYVRGVAAGSPSFQPLCAGGGSFQSRDLVPLFSALMCGGGRDQFLG